MRGENYWIDNGKIVLLNQLEKKSLSLKMITKAYNYMIESNDMCFGIVCPLNKQHCSIEVTLKQPS